MKISRRCTLLFLAAGLALLAAGYFQIQLDASPLEETTTPTTYPLTSGGRWFIGGWSPDGETQLIGRWGETAGEGSTRQSLGELWAMDITGGGHTLISRNAVQPSFRPDGGQIIYLAYVDGAWQARSYDTVSHQESNLGQADWRMPPTWINQAPVVFRQGQVRQAEDNRAVSFGSLPEGVQVKISPDGKAAAWSSSQGLWVTSLQDGSIRSIAENSQVMSFIWSPNSRQLAFVSAPDPTMPELWVADTGQDENALLLLRGQDETFSQPAWSPDGSQLAFSRTPVGAGTAISGDIWLAGIIDGSLLPLLINDLEESAPSWSPNGRYLAFQRDGDVWIMNLTGGLTKSDSLLDATPTPAAETISPYRQIDAQLTPPDTIRVIHDARNTYRDVPAGQIDEIGFEEYVKRVVPLEISPASWPEESIKVQAVASRTFGWYFVLLHEGQDWDVSDWTDYQVMGREDQKHPNSNAAVKGTKGQYIAYQGDVIKAFYCADGGSPTVGIDSVAYIKAVDDPVSFGESRVGHGWGLSQRGAKRWAEQHGWDYQQILSHYYTGVTIELPSTGGPMPLGGLALPWSDFFITTNHVFLKANASDEQNQTSAVRFYESTGSPTLLATDTSGVDGWSTVWDVTGLEDTSDKPFDLYVIVTDAQNNVQTDTGIVEAGLDRQPPVGQPPTVADFDEDSLIVTLNLSASDPAPGSGLSGMGFSNEGWSWEGESLYHQTGEQVADPGALNGVAWRARVGVHQSGAWYGPYTYNLPVGQEYRAFFRLKTNNVTTPEVVAILDIVDNAGARLLGIRRIRGTDFRQAGVYQEFSVDWVYPDAGTSGVEFRTAYQATADLYLDRVLVTSYPIDYATTASWQLLSGEGNKKVTVKFLDRAGNVSEDKDVLIEVIDTQPPGNWSNWSWHIEPNKITFLVQVKDAISGLDVSSGRFRYSMNNGQSWSSWSAASCTGSDGTTNYQTVSLPNLPITAPMDKPVLLEVEISDINENIGATSHSFRIDLFFLPLVIR